MQKISGNRIFTGTFCAISSARWLRFTRRSLACTRSTFATGMPKVSACTMAVTKPRSSATFVRSATARRASILAKPICIS